MQPDKRAGAVTITTDDEGAQTILNALDLYMRVAMGQWDRIAEAAPDVIGFDAMRECEDDLLAVRTAHTHVTPLTHPRAALSISTTHRRSKAAYDLWHALGGGMESRRGDRLTDVPFTVTGAQL